MTYTCANRQLIVEVFPPGHRRATSFLDRQDIVEIGVGSDPSSNVDVTPDTAVAEPQQGGDSAGWGAAIPTISTGNSRRAPRAGQA